MFRRHRPKRGGFIGVPRGMLFYIVLRALNCKPMSGSELMTEIKEVTGWRLSPGSIYPLLSKLRGDNSIEPVKSEEPGLKYFTLTEKGVEELERHKKQGDIFRDRYHSIRRIYLKLFKEMDDELYKSSSRLLDIIEEVDAVLKEKREISEKVLSILNNAVEEIEEIKRQVKND